MRGHSTIPWRRGRHHFQASVTGERGTGNEKAVLRFRGEPFCGMQMTIRENLAKLRERIEAAAAKAGRHADEITLIGVSKTHPSEAMREAYEAGLRHFGENRVQEWEAKRPRLDDLHGATWQLVAHLQSNKAGKAARLFHSVDSVDDWELAQKLDRACEGKTAGERLLVAIKEHPRMVETKAGAVEFRLAGLAEQIGALEQGQL